MKVLVLNGPNLGRLGRRDPAVYGSTTHTDLVDLCDRVARELDIEVEVRQTDGESEMLGWLHEAADRRLPVVINAAAWTHTSVAVRDACHQLGEPFIEVHISNIHQRESFRQHSYLSDIASGVIVGFGIRGYALALRALAGSD
ncbi:3-dehydroquinate dehydratase-2 [Saccharopolyspora lacisalsi]|uniref:3-dehydroquinate dehydratase n=1 Tax=Halosaccharopolyspora lacisalsi TaxID=1000566 RepID=A0A839DPU6_9PSEU|nr:type II 3-dehydroquinate dehydratase [Halosaccharopolyspora lacisalsi]MBA8823524.1 3-dehydroquinate dehydratase-2 [Halosaccharopolyspora lacisalsi]